MRTTLLTLCLGLCMLTSGCSRPDTPSLTGVGKLHDITQVKRGMTQNEVLRVMGANYTSAWEEGINGIDSGNYIWQYPEGRIYFSLQAVTRVAPN